MRYTITLKKLLPLGEAGWGSRCVSWSFLLIALLLLASCEKVDLTNGDEGGNIELNGKKYKVSVTTRSATTDIQYPIIIKVTNGAGEVVAQQSVNSADEKISLSLPNGKYMMSAISGSTDFSKGFSLQPLMIGSSDFTVDSSSTNITIVMAYAVASLSMSMTNVPDDVSSMNVTVSPVSSSITETGNYSGSRNVEIPCSKSGSGQWTTGKVYLLPGSGSNTVLSVSLSSPSGKDVYSVTYPTPLEASVPYNFTGEYSGITPSDFTISGTLQYQGWSADVSGTFSFGPGGTNSFSDLPESPVSEDVTVSSMPAQGSVWNGHVVAYVDGSNALLLSKEEWTSLTSALYEADPDVAKNLAYAYKESELSGWAIPTSDEARLLKAAWTTDNFDDLNSLFSTVNGKKVSMYEEEKGNARYLCQSARSTFSFAPKSSITAAGATVKTYRLRLVKSVHFIIK